jgi:DNA processing protein
MAEIQPNSPDITEWLRLINAEGVGPVTFARLLKRFRSPDRALGASISELAKVDGIGPRTAQSISATREKFDAEAELELAARLGAFAIHFNDPRYPRLLKEIYDPPPVLYVKGTLTTQDSLAISIVGSRRCSLYGQEQASRFAHFLAAAGFTICSGMARGIDTSAHQGALAAHGRTIAVQGCGLATVYPPENKKLFEMITDSGACMTELPLRTEPKAENFPPRNRIVAGLSLGTLVIDASLRSGALITAKAALDYNREVMAVPGRIDSPQSRGPNQLLRQGATLVESIEDIMEALGYIGEQLQDHAARASAIAQQQMSGPGADTSRLTLTRDESAVYAALTKEPLHIDRIIAETGLSAGTVNSTLVSLRLKGLTNQFPGNSFARK